MDILPLIGKKLALLLIAKILYGNEEEEDVIVLAGPATWDGTKLWIDYGDTDHQFPVPEICWGDFQPVPDDVRDIFRDASFFESIKVGQLEEDADYAGSLLTGQSTSE